MKKRQVKKIVAVATMGMLLLSAVPVSALSLTEHGHTMEYNSKKVSSVSAYASTTCTGPRVNYVRATLHYTYMFYGESRNDFEVATQTYATTAGIYFNDDNVAIQSVSGFHEAGVIDNGAPETLRGWS